MEIHTISTYNFQVFKLKSEDLERAQSTNAAAERNHKFIEYLKKNVWPLVKPEFRNRPMTREEEDDVLGFDPQQGV